MISDKDAPANDLHRYSATLNPKVRGMCANNDFLLIDTATLCYIRQASLVLVAPARDACQDKDALRHQAPGQRPS